MRNSVFCFLIWAGPIAAEPVQFEASDFGKIVIAPRQSTSSGFQFEQAFGDYQNEPIIRYGDDTPAVRLGRPVGRLDLLYKNGKTGFCTAFIVDDQHIVTNHHCVPGMDGDPLGVDSSVEAAQFVAGYIQPGRADGADRYSVSTRIVETDRKLDYTVLKVFGDPSTKYGALEIADSDPENGEFLWIIGHPAGQSQHISREGCAAAVPAVSDEGKLVHSCDTLNGNSGSPVIRTSDRKVIGLHHAGDSVTGFNYAIPMSRILAQSTILVAAAPARADFPSPQTDPCTVLWSEAKNLGCVGYKVYKSSCGDHVFAPLADSLIEQSCAKPDLLVALPPKSLQPDAAVAPPQAVNKLPPLDRGVITVNPTGGADYTALETAINAARDGDQIALFPGTYSASIDITKHLKIFGHGPRDKIILRPREAGAIFHLRSKAVQISGLTFLADLPKTSAILVTSGEVTIDGNAFQTTGTAIIFDRWQTGDESTGVVMNNWIHNSSGGSGISVNPGATPTIQDNMIENNAGNGITAFLGASPAILRNTLRVNKKHGIWVFGDGAPKIEGNTISDNAEVGISLEQGAKPDVQQNVIVENAGGGLSINGDSTGSFLDNEISRNGTFGIYFEGAGEPSAVFVENTIDENRQAGILTGPKAFASIVRNRIRNNVGPGARVQAAWHLGFQSNRFLGNGQNALVVEDGATVFFVENDVRGSGSVPYLISKGATILEMKDNVED